uniref:Ovule protein n=1 Tax=Heterorhabditis bacteriophora TaxID=37862 RepID=A0A1I7WAC7_HETBA
MVSFVKVIFDFGYLCSWLHLTMVPNWLHLFMVTFGVFPRIPRPACNIQAGRNIPPLIPTRPLLSLSYLCKPNKPNSLVSYSSITSTSIFPLDNITIWNAGVYFAMPPKTFSLTSVFISRVNHQSHQIARLIVITLSKFVYLHICFYIH